MPRRIAGRRKSKTKKICDSFINKDGTRKQSSIERKMEQILINMGLYYTSEKKFSMNNKTKSFDFYISDGLNYHILCEVDGSYWHAADYLEGKQSYDSLAPVQKKNLRNDKFKDKLAKHIGIPLIRIKENDVKNNTQKIIDIIEEEIKRQTKSLPKNFY